ncbi:MAG: argininosuccinate lyase [Clostridiales bacterium]|nr:argininosuccinate lyase [Clostridiales bacterium]
MKLWGGRFSKNTDSTAGGFHSSIGFDQRLYAEDIAASIAHASMLGSAGIISGEEARRLIDALGELAKEIDRGEVVFDTAEEDIHTNIEMLLTQKLGELGKKLHTARSRNDQVATDLRLYLRRQTLCIEGSLKELVSTLADLAGQHTDTVMPGYTHLQPGQPVTFAHHLLAYAQMFMRDLGRLRDSRRRMNFCPLGSAALAGTTFPIDRVSTAAQLGFTAPTANSMDSVADRDFALEFLSAAAIIMMHLSRFCEELVLWSSREFSFIRLDDAYSTGSSIMPQKKNPDMAELIRGKTGRVYGNLLALLTVMKGLPLAYNKDMQEDKEAVFDAADTLRNCLQVFTPMLAGLQVEKENIRRAAGQGFINATDMADYLVRKGLPFRAAHEVTGKLVLYAEGSAKTLEELSMDELRAQSPLFGDDVYEAISLKRCVAARASYGGPAPEAVATAIAETRLWLLETEAGEDIV